MRLSGRSNIADSLNDVPSFKASSTPVTGGLSSQTPGGSFLNLRALGANRTLVLVDGRRHVPTTSSGLVDLNVVPGALIERVEVVTGGASAAWGSDAVAGVVNLIFDKELQGIKAEVQGGLSNESDNRDIKASLAGGTAFADGRGHIVAAVEASDNEGVLDQRDRSWGARDWQLIANRDDNGDIKRLITPNAHLATATEGGLITTGVHAGTQFLPGGATAPFTYGTSSGASYMIGGDGLNVGSYASISVPVERQNAFTRATWSFTDRVEGFVELSYARSQSRNEIIQPYDLGSLEIGVNNAYLPAELAAEMLDAGEGSFLFGRINTDFGFYTTDVENATRRGVVGFEGTLGNGWNWDAYYQHGQTDYDAKLLNNRITARYLQSIDAVTDPAAGQIVCNSTLTAPDNGCVPVNLFGAGSPSADALAWFLGTQWLDSKITQRAAGASIRGEPFSVPAGPVSFATGVEYRKEEVETSVDPLSATGAFAIGNPKAITGSYDVKEVFAETVVPLLAGKPGIEALDLNVAARVTDYSTSGSVTTWKAGLSYTVNDQVRFRATRSRDIRAPNLDELYTAGQLRFGTVVDPVSKDQVQISTLSGGNVNLDPEEADTLTAGVVFTPSWLRGVRASVDVYDIDLQGAIGTITPQETVDRCAAGAASLCSLVIRDSSGTITQIVATQINLSQLKTSGVDMELSYSTPLSAIASSWGGELSLRMLATYVDELITNDGRVSIDRAGDVGSDVTGIPHWRWNASATYYNGPLTAHLQGRYVGGGKYDHTFGEFGINDNDIKSVFYVDASAQYTLHEQGDSQLQLFGAINNLLDKDPPINPTSFLSPSATNKTLYDVIGRYYTLGMRYNF